MGAYRQTGPYMPQADSAFRDWLGNFADLIQANPERFGLDHSDATIIVNCRKSYEQAYTLAKQNSTRTPSVIAKKDAEKARAMASMRTYAGLIRSIMANDNETLISLGLKPRNTSRTPIPAPATAPVIMPICGFPLATQLRFADALTPHSSRKPVGVAFLELAVAVQQPGERLPTRPEQASMREVCTRQPIVVEHRPEDGMKMAAFFGRWMTARGLAGPWSVPAYFTVVAGGWAAPDGPLKEMRVPELDRLARQQRRAAELEAK